MSQKYQSLFTPPAYTNRYQKWFNGKTIILLVLAVVASVFITRFFEKLHYDGLLQAAYVRQGRLSAASNDQQIDLKYLINASNSPVNCYQLISSYAKQACNQHNLSLH